jgi:DNA polymerase-4
MSGLHYFYSTPLEAAEKIQTDIRETLDFTVNIGISSNKLLAKMASDFEKPDKIHTLFPSEIEKKCGIFLFALSFLPEELPHKS